MAKCLEVAFKANIPKPQRRRIVAKTADWTMLEKPWRSLVYIAMQEIEPPGDDEDKPSMIRPHRGSTRRTRGGVAQTPLDWLPSLEEITLDTDSSEAFRLAVLLINKQLKKDDWKDEYNSLEQSLRDYCLESGISATWQKLAQHTTLLGQFLAFPISKKKQKKSTKKADISKARIDINDSEKVLSLLNEFSSLCEDAETQVALQKVISQIKSKRAVDPSKELLELKGSASIISVLITMHSGKDSSKAIKEL